MTAWKIAVLVVAGCLGLSLTPACAAEPEHGFVHKVYKDPSGDEAKYVVFIPHDYKGDKAYPVILFLHGSGETGTDGEAQVRVGVGKAIQKNEKTFEFITVFPQAHVRPWRADSPAGKRALAILDQVMKDYKCDSKRVYLTGLSMGGFGTWSFAEKYPDRWAAIVPICGGGNPASAAKVMNIPCWCFQGGADPVVKPERARAMMDAIKAAPGKDKKIDLKYTEYPGIGHNSWDKAYATPELYEWLLKHQSK